MLIVDGSNKLLFSKLFMEYFGKKTKSQVFDIKLRRQM